MKHCMEKLGELLELGGMKKDITLLVISGIALLLSIFKVEPFPFSIAWVAILLCGIPIILEANVGIAMGGVGSDVAVDAADIALVDDEVRELPHLIALSKRMMITIKCNMSFSVALNFVAIVLAITGVLNPVAGALVHNAGSVLVIINSALLLNWKKQI